jgi:hypothetical protein
MKYTVTKLPAWNCASIIDLAGERDQSIEGQGVVRWSQIQEGLACELLFQVPSPLRGEGQDEGSGMEKLFVMSLTLALSPQGRGNLSLLCPEVTLSWERWVLPYLHDITGRGSGVHVFP